MLEVRSFGSGALLYFILPALGAQCVRQAGTLTHTFLYFFLCSVLLSHALRFCFILY